MSWKKKKKQACVIWWKCSIVLWGKSIQFHYIHKWWLMHSNRMSNLPNYRHLDGLRMKILFVWICPEVNLNEVYFIMPDSTNGLQSQSEQKPWHVNKCAKDGRLHYSFCPQPTQEHSTPSKISVTNRWHHYYHTSTIKAFS